MQNSRLASVSWNPPFLHEQNGIIRQYLVTVTSSFSTNTHTVSSSQNSLILQNLRPYTSHTCSVQAVTIENGPSIIQTFQTPEDGKIYSLFGFFVKHVHYIYVLIYVLTYAQYSPYWSSTAHISNSTQSL